MPKIFKNKYFISVLFLIIFSCVAYLPKIQSFGFYNDDWWQIYGGENFGVEHFPEMYASDRPARAHWHAFLFSFFESNILPYQLIGFGIRLLGAVALFWTLSLIWKKQIKEIFFMSLIFLIYPGFLEMPNGFDYQSHQIAITTFIFSVGLSVVSIKSKRIYKRISLLLVSSVFSLITFFFMEYFVGLEVYRWLIFISFYMREHKLLPIKKFVNYITKIIPYSFSMFFFLIWRVFFFTSTRYTTDISRLGYDYIHSPILSIVNVFRRWIGDIGDIYFTVWVKKGYKNLYELNTNDYLIAVLLGIFSIIIFILYWKLVNKNSERSNEVQISNENRWKIEAILIGFLGAIICLIPINLANREVYFPIFNRFSFPSSIGVSISIIGVISYFFKGKWQLIPLSLLIFSSISSHYSNNTYYADRWVETKNFWQQWIWRIPGIEKGTMLTGFYPETIQEGYFIWAPANLLYYLDSPEVMIGAEVLNNDTYKDIQMNKSFEKSFRSFYFNFSFEDTLVFSKPTRDSCLRIIDYDQIELSIYDHPLISLVSSQSKIKLISQENSVNIEMFEKIFGQQNSELSWCYIYQKATVARQFEDWEEIVKLYGLADQQNLIASDPVEWFPFLQAFAYTGMNNEFNRLASIINETSYYRYQACQLFLNKEVNPGSSEQNGNQLIVNTFCD